MEVFAVVENVKSLMATSSQEVPADVFPARLKAARKLRGLEQGDVAARAVLPSTSISHFEAGSRKPSFDNLRRLAKALEVSTDFLLGLADHPDASTSADPLYRHGQRLTSEDRDLADKFLALLANRNRAAREP